MQSRISWVDYAKAGSIFLVVLGHAEISDSLHKFFYVFHIPLFFFLSGLFFQEERYPDYKTFITQRAKQLLIPYLFFNLISFTFWWLVGRHFGKDAGESIHVWTPLVGILYGNASLLVHNVPLWFLACLFCVEHLYFFVSRSKKHSIRILLVLFLSVLGYVDYHFNTSFQLPWGMQMALVVLVFYGFGSLLSRWLRTSNFTYWSLIIVAVISGVLFFWLLPYNEVVEVSAHQYGTYILFYVGAFLGIACVLSVMMLLEKVVPPIQPLLYIGRNTLIILGFHLLAGSVVKGIAFYLFSLPIDLFENDTTAILYAMFSLVILLPVIWIVNNYFPLLIGKTDTKRKI